MHWGWRAGAQQRLEGLEAQLQPCGPVWFEYRPLQWNHLTRCFLGCLGGLAGVHSPDTPLERAARLLEGLQGFRASRAVRRPDSAGATPATGAPRIVLTGDPKADGAHC